MRAQQGSEGEWWERDGGRIYVGFGGQSTSVVNITNGGTMKALSGNVGDTGDDGSIWIGTGAAPGSTAIVNVDGEGSTVKADTYIGVGAHDTSNVTAQLNITNGADVEVTNGYAYSGEATDTDMFVSAFTVDSEASVTVNGSGSTLTVDELQIGGSQTIMGYTADGTPVAYYEPDIRTVGEQVTDAEGNLIYEDGILNGGGTIVGDVNVEGGTVAPGNSPGTLTIDGDFIVDSGILEIEVASLTSYDIFDVSGDIYIGSAFYFWFAI